MQDFDELIRKTEDFNEFSMQYEVYAHVLKNTDYLVEFFDFYEICDREHSLIESTESFNDLMRNLAGDDVFLKIIEKSEALFGTFLSLKVFDDDEKIKEELEGPDGLSIFFFVFDLFFCEYDGFTILFISGTNN